MHHLWSLLLLLVAFQLSDPIVCDPDLKIRQKRDVVCSDKLKVAVEEVLYSSLKDIGGARSIKLDDAWGGKLYNGILSLSSTTNVTDIGVICDGKDVMNIGTAIRVKSPKASYKWTQKMLFFSLYGTVIGKARSLDIALRARLYISSYFDVKVVKTEITNVDGIEFDFEGLGMLNWAAKKILDYVSQKWQGELNNKIGEILKIMLKKELNEKIDFSQFS